MRTMTISGYRWLAWMAWSLAVMTMMGAEAPATFSVSGLTFARPAAWEWVPVNSTMRKAQLKVPGSDQNPGAEVVFFFFGEGNGGGTQANIDRWFGQFQEPRDKIEAKTESVTLGGHKVTYVQAQGTYMSGMPGGPKTAMANHRLLGAIIEDPQGNIFVRLTGPIALAKSAEADFKKMIESAFKGK